MHAVPSAHVVPRSQTAPTPGGSEVPHPTSAIDNSTFAHMPRRYHPRTSGAAVASVDGAPQIECRTSHSITGTSELTPAPANEIGMFVIGSLNVANTVPAPVVRSIITTWPVWSCVKPITLPSAYEVPNSFG